MVGSIRFLFVLAAVCCTASAQAAVPNIGPYFVHAGRFVIKPIGTIDLSGTDSYEIGSTYWMTWTRSGATGQTTYYMNLCKPDCARGRYERQPAHVRFFGIVRCREKAVYTNFAVTSLAGKRLLAGDFRSIGFLNGC